MAESISRKLLNRQQLSHWESFRYGLGISISLCGISLAMLLNYIFPGVPWTPAIMFLSVLCLFPYEHFSLKGKMDHILKMVLCIQVLMLIYWIFSENFDKKFNYLSFHLYILAFIFVLRTNPNLHKANFLGILFIFSASLSIIFAIIHFSGLYVVHIMEFRHERILEVFTMNRAAFANLIAGTILIGGSKKTWFKILLTVLIAIDIYVVVKSGKRSYFVNIFVVMFYIALRNRKRIDYIVAISITLIIALFFISEVQNTFSMLMNRTISGFMDVYGSQRVMYDENSSSSIRAFALQAAIRDFQDFNSFEQIFGKGYYSYYIDNPILEAYLDMGIVGFCLFFYVAIVMPLRLFWKVPYKNKEAILVYCFALMTIVISLTNNNPYQYINYTPLCILATYLYADKKRESRIISIKDAIIRMRKLHA